MSRASPSKSARVRASRDVAVLIALQKARDERARILVDLRADGPGGGAARERLEARRVALERRIRQLDRELGPEPTPSD